MGFTRNALIRKIPVFEQGFLPTVLVYTDKDLVADSDIIYTRVVSRQNSGDVILELVSKSQPSSTPAASTENATSAKINDK